MNRVDGKPTVYRRGLASFTIKYIYPMPGISVLLSYLCLKYQITPDQGKSLNWENECTVFITNCDINCLGNLNATFPTLSQTQLTLYSTGDKQD